MNLNELKPHIDDCVKFAKQYPPTLRAPIMTFLLGVETTVHGKHSAPNRVIVPAQASPTLADVAVLTDNGGVVVTFDGSSAAATIAAETGVEVRAVQRAIRFDAEGRPQLRGLRADEDSMARKQIAYSLVYLYVLEAAGRDSATSDELRRLCEEKHCYDSPNFTRNYKVSPWIDGLGAGPRRKEWMLTQAGRAEARQVLRRLLALPDVTGPARNEVPSVQDGGSDGDATVAEGA